jgi:hypothetical protein
MSNDYLGAVVVVIIWYLDLQLPVESVSITTRVATSISVMARCPRCVHSTYANILKNIYKKVKKIVGIG